MSLQRDKAKGIGMSNPMLLALLSRRKFETRRLCPTQPFQDEMGLWNVYYPWGEGGHGCYETKAEMRKEYDRLMLAYSRYHVGEYLFAREPWRTDISLDDKTPKQAVALYREMGGPFPVRYEVDSSSIFWAVNNEIGRYRHGRFMPRELARIFLKVTSVSIEEVQEITEAGAINEGIIRESYIDVKSGKEVEVWIGYPCGVPYDKPVEAYSELWDKVNLSDPDVHWDKNPFVSTIKFEIVEIKYQ